MEALLSLSRGEVHAAGIHLCDPATGVCSNPNKTDGSACNDGSACTSAVRA
jgi:hypothetical protein